MSTAAPIPPAHVQSRNLNDLGSYTQNLSARGDELARISREHAGEMFARSLDGTREYAFAKTWEELVGKLNAAGIDPEFVVIGDIDSFDSI